jgi:hypothetical protein
LNVGRLVAPLEAPAIADFVANLEPINALAEARPGFVWRLQTEDGNATAIKVSEDERFIINLSVWESLEALSDFVYRSDHMAFLRRRREWFERPVEAIVVLWWVPAGTVPTIADALARLEHLRAHGPTPHAFTFRQPFDPLDGAARRPDDRNACPA